jgi:hypothetical protein
LIGAGIRRGEARVWIAAGALFLASVAIRWPGVAMYDSVAQYRQILDGAYSDWHPPIMARTWALLRPVHDGTAPFFLIQMLLWWGGLAGIAAALAARKRGIAAACVLAIGASPLLLGWATVILKDAQMAACLVAATGIFAQYRLRGAPVPWPVRAAILVLIVYAALVRGNAAFACAPLALALVDWGGVRSRVGRVALTLVATLAVLLVSPAINQRLLGAEASHADRSLPIYDLAGIGHFAGPQVLPGLPGEEWQRAEAAHCYSPFFWNPYGEPDQCGFVGDRLAFDRGAGDGLRRFWVRTIVAHPLAYAAHRLLHLNANLRLWTDSAERDALPPVDSEPNGFGIGAHAGPAARALIAAARWQVASPLGWPISWLVLSLVLLWASARRDDPQVRLGRALAFSAACMSASYAIVSIASDLRYHLWSILAAALAGVLLLDARGLDPRRARIGGAVLLAFVLVGIAARLGLAASIYAPQPAYVPPPPGAPPRV